MIASYCTVLNAHKTGIRGNVKQKKTNNFKTGS